MSISLELVNFDRMFAQLPQPPIIINDISQTSEEDKKILQRQTTTIYQDDLLDNLPSCDCGEIKGQYNMGVLCPNCGTHVVSSTEQELNPIIWMRSPIGVAKLINPEVITFLSQRFTKSGFDIIRYLCDTNYSPKARKPPEVFEIDDLGVERGYNYFVTNFSKILDLLFGMKKLRGKDKSDLIPELLSQQSECVFSNYLPLPNRSLLVIEPTNTGTYVDNVLIGAIDAIHTIASVDAVMSKHSVRVKENRTAKTLFGLAEFYESYYKEGFGKKAGQFRQHLFGGRSQWSFRAVVSSITEPHQYDEIHIPWGIGVTVFRYHLSNKLKKLGFTANSSLAFLNAYTKIYHPLLDKLMCELIDESPRKGIEVTLNRNPSLARGSIQLVRITKVKKDPKIPTVSFSILIVTPLNAD